MITGNKGEWSEVYALFKLLSDKKLFIGDADLNKIKDLFYPIIKIIRNDNQGDVSYKISKNWVDISTNGKSSKLALNKFTEQAEQLLQSIRSSTGIFGLPKVEAFMNIVHCRTLKAKSTSKTDIRIVIHDITINQIAELGFSIKSHLGGASTLLNAGKTTNFIYEIIGFKPTFNELTSINDIATPHKVRDRLNAIKSRNGVLKYVGLENHLFKSNLILIDSLLPDILGEILKTFYASEASSVEDLATLVSSLNPLNFETKFEHAFYKYKIKRFLSDTALGMMPSKVWSGIYDATGGYLIIKKDGEVLCYHIYNRNQFEDYLFANTKLETASTKRHDFGMIYEENGRYYFKLNLQVRFK
ncbi:MAG: HpaII family restriction endonuclease [Blastochloris sp.]|mgnify:CR=1 FL=1|nr:HpaII family restriction endonuclease [Blastochloris sp.]